MYTSFASGVFFILYFMLWTSQKLLKTLGVMLWITLGNLKSDFIRSIHLRFSLRVMNTKKNWTEKLLFKKKTLLFHFHNNLGEVKAKKSFDFEHQNVPYMIWHKYLH